jgi:hypothetical protein
MSSGGNGSAAMSGITQEDIARFDAAFYGADTNATAELTLDRLRQWLAAMSAPDVPDVVLKVRRTGHDRHRNGFSSAAVAHSV